MTVLKFHLVLCLTLMAIAICLVGWGVTLMVKPLSDIDMVIDTLLSMLNSEVTTFKMSQTFKDMVGDLQLASMEALAVVLSVILVVRVLVLVMATAHQQEGAENPPQEGIDNFRKNRTKVMKNEFTNQANDDGEGFCIGCFQIFKGSKGLAMHQNRQSVTISRTCPGKCRACGKTFEGGQGLQDHCRMSRDEECNKVGELLKELKLLKV